MKVYQVEDLAKMMGVTERWIRMMLGRGDIPGRKVGRRWFVSEMELHKYLNTTPDDKVDEQEDKVVGDAWVMEVKDVKSPEGELTVEKMKELSKDVTVSEQLPDGKSMVERLLDGEVDGV